MKKSLISILVGILFLLGCSSESKDVGNDTPENFGKSVLNALKINDKDLFKKYVYTKYEVEYLNANSTKPSDIDRLNKFYERLLGMCEKLRLEASEKGLNDWDNVEFSKFSFDLSRDGLRAKNTRLEFINGDYVGSIRFRTICKSDRGWFMAGVPKFSRYRLKN